MTALLDSATAHDPDYSVETFSGDFVDLSNCLPQVFDLVSIANGLSKICRYGSQAQFHYSVAEHAYWVSKRLEWVEHSPEVQLAGLHHDDAEAIMGDVTTPMKRYLAREQEELLAAAAQEARDELAELLPDLPPDRLAAVQAAVTARVARRREAILKKLEQKLMEAIIPGLGLYPGEVPLHIESVKVSVKNADLWALAGEARQLTRSGGLGWSEIGEYDPHPDLSAIGLGPERAASLWLARHHELVAKVRRLPTPKSHV